MIDHAPAEKAFDLVILGDGFTQAEAPLEGDDAALRASAFGVAAQSMADALFKVEPYKSMQASINVWIVATPSVDEGADLPATGEIRDTFYDTTFGADCIDRALVIRESLRALEVANETPFDQALMLVNSSRYGGTGGVIPTVALSGDYAATLIHELGHSVGLLSDNYSYFSDDEQSSACTDLREKESLDAIDPALQNGKNTLSKVESEVAPNLTLVGDLGLAKWADFLTAISPVIKFAYPMAPGQQLLGRPIVEWKFTTAAPIGSLHLYSGLRTDISARVFAGTALAVNDVLVPFETVRVEQSEPPPFTPAIDVEKLAAYTGTTFANWHTPLAQTVPAGPVSIKITYPSIAAAARAAAQSWSAHSLMIADQEFDVRTLGVYQGAGPSLTQVFRSSFTSMMATLEYDHDAVERTALAKAIDRYIPAPQ